MREREKQRELRKAFCSFKVGKSKLNFCSTLTIQCIILKCSGQNKKKKCRRNPSVVLIFSPKKIITEQKLLFHILLAFNIYALLMKST